MAQIRSLRAVIVSMLGTVPTIPETEPQNDQKRAKRIEDYPEVLILHFVVSLRTMQRTLFTSGPVPVKYLVIVPGQTGANLVFKRDEIVAWMTARKQETKDEFIKRIESQLAARLRK